MTNILPKIIAILGPTSSGKSDVAVLLAKKFDGEVISADSRQVYKGLDIATGKITEEEMRDIPHHMLDVADPKDQYSVAQFKREAEKIIDDILKRNKTPIICGGTGQYVDAITENYITPTTLPNYELREELSGKTVEQLYSELLILDPKRALDIDRNNPRRLIRAIEIAHDLGTVPKQEETPLKYDALKIAISTDKETLRSRIEMRTQKRIDQGMIDEAKSLHENGLTFKRMRELGLEYKYLADYLEGEITIDKLKQEIFFKDWQYAKRQMTWLKRDTNIHWFALSDMQKIFDEVKYFLEK